MTNYETPSTPDQFEFALVPDFVYRHLDMIRALQEQVASDRDSGAMYDIKLHVSENGPLRVTVARQEPEVSRAERPARTLGDFALAEIAVLREDITIRQERLAEFVEMARDEGESWGSIGSALEVTRQAARRKFDAEARAKHSAYKRRD